MDSKNSTQDKPTTLVKSDTTLVKSDTLEKHPQEIKISAQDSKKFFRPSDKQLVRYTDISLYSTTPYEQAIYTAELLRCYYTAEQLKSAIITDGNACIGGNTWAFAKIAKQCIAVELEPLHAEILAHNIAVLNADNVTVIAGNVIDEINKAPSVPDKAPSVPDKAHQSINILFLDPPWGGIDYRTGGHSLGYYGAISGTATGTDTSATSIDASTGNTTPTFIPLEDIVSGFASYKYQLVMLKIPYTTHESILNSLKKSNFLHYEEILITTKKDQPIYKIIILSHTDKITPLLVGKFDKVGYKHMQYKLV